MATQTCGWCAEEIPGDAVTCPMCQGSVATGRAHAAAVQTAPAAGSPAAKAPAGWYDDPKLVNTRRYWDGEKWTDHRIEKSSSKPAMPPGYGASAGGQDEPKDAVVVVGVLTAFFFPIVGFILGLTQINKRGSSGIWIVVLSLVGFVIWYLVISENISDANRYNYP